MLLRKADQGFTIIEVLIATSIAAILIVIAYGLFNGTIGQYNLMSQDAVNFSQLSMESQRVTKILRGSTDVLEATNSAVTVYAYFTPRDATVSKIRYYVSSTQLKADVTQMTANPPIGTPVPNSTVTYTIISKLQTGGLNVFDYLDSAGGILSLPIADLHTIKGIRVTLKAPPSKYVSANGTTVTSDVALRNRKTNL